MKRGIAIAVLLALVASAYAGSQQSLLRRAWASRGQAAATYDPFPIRTDMIGGWLVKDYVTRTNYVAGAFNVTNIYENVLGGTNDFFGYRNVVWQEDTTNSLVFISGATYPYLPVNGVASGVDPFGSGTQNFSINLWIKTKHAAFSTLITKSQSYGGAGWFVMLTNVGKIRSSWGQAGVTAYIYDSSPVVNDGSWHMVSIVTTNYGNSGSVFHYIDGTNYTAAKLEGSGTITNLYYPYPLMMGSGFYNADYRYAGTNDTVSIFTNALTAEQVMSLYNNGKLGGRHQ